MITFEEEKEKMIIELEAQRERNSRAIRMIDKAKDDKELLEVLKVLHLESQEQIKKDIANFGFSK